MRIGKRLPNSCSEWRWSGVIAILILGAMALISSVEDARAQGLLDDPNVTGITVYEMTTSQFVHTFAKTDPRLVTDLDQNPPTNAEDFHGVASERYDVFMSNADGTLNAAGDFVTIECYWSGAGAGNNIDAVMLEFTGGIQLAATVVSSYQLGTSGANGADGSVTAALGSPNTVSTGLGTQYSRLTVGYPQSCFCPCANDPSCDGLLSDVLDVIEVLNASFRGCTPTQDPGCPYSRTDVNADGATDVLDVVRVVNVAFRCFSIATQYSDPCSPSPNLSSTRYSALIEKATTPVDVSMANSVIVESKTVAPNATGVEVGISITNDAPLIGIVLPLEIRETVPGAYVTGSFTFVRVPGGRIDNSPLGAAGPTWPAASVTQKRMATPLANSCSGPTSSTWCTPTANIDFISPDAVFYGGVAAGDPSINEDIELAPGSDPPGTGGASFKMTFDVTGVPGCIVIDTCCVAPGNHLSFVANAGLDVCDGPTIIYPAFTAGCVTIGATVDCASNTTTEPPTYFVACPKGDEPFRVFLKDASGDPIEGYSDVTLDFSACPGGTLIPVPGKHPSWPIVYPVAPSDQDGMVQFNVFAGGDCADCEVTISTQCGYSAVLPVHSVDVNGDLCVDASDHASTEGICRDYNASGTLTTADYFIHNAHRGHCAPLGACDNISIALSVSPQDELSQGDQITVDWTLTNVDNLGVCNITAIEFYHFDCASSSTLNEVAEVTVNQLLLPGGTLSGQVTYTNPDALDFCLEVRVYSNCCATYASQIVPMTIRNFCSIGDACVAFYCSPLDITGVEFFDDQLLAEGWTYDVQVLNVDPIGLVTQTLICTGPDPEFGQSGTVVITHNGYGGAKSYTFKNEPAGGDVCGRLDDCEMTSNRRVPDCVIDVLDVVCMINYIFQGGQSPCPTVNVDLNCDCSADIVDIVRLVNTAFRGQPPPEKCVTYPVPNCWD